MNGFKVVRTGPWWIVSGFVGLTMLATACLIYWDVSADPLVLLCAPILVTPLFFPRWTCWIMTGVLAASALWTVHVLRPAETPTSAKTIALFSLMLLGQAEIVRRVVSARERHQQDLLKSERRLSQALDRLRTSQHQLVRQERLRTIGLMASGVAHDLNNSLVPIVSYAELVLRDDQLNDRARNQLQLILSAAKDTASVVKRLQEYSRRKRAAAPADLLNLMDVVKDIPALTRPKWRDEAALNGREIHFELQVDDVPPVRGNAAELRQVLINLVFNAVEAMPGGGRLLVRLKPAHEWAVIEVQDTGVGMSDRQRQRCLEPFFSTTKHGCGLGLSVCHTVILSQGGKLEIESGPGEGSLFRILLPAVQPAPELPPFDRGKQQLAQPLRVLCVDDERSVRESIHALASTLGHQVDVVADGAEALAALDRRHPYHVLITDLGMPKMDGKQLTKAAKKRDPSLPVIMISGWDEMDRDVDWSVRPDWFMQKPITLAMLDEALSRMAAMVDWDAGEDEERLPQVAEIGMANDN